MQEQPRIVDFFCGCGGFSLGAHAAKLPVALAVDLDKILTSSFEANFPKTRLLNADVAQLSGSTVEAAAGGKVDIVFGGPPCQGFSSIGRRAADDPRRTLVRHFFRLVTELQPKYFVMENVPGLGAAHSKAVLDEGLALVDSAYEVLGPLKLNAADFGAATNRKRLFVIGSKRALADRITEADINKKKSTPASVRAAIDDLSGAVELEDLDGFDQWKITKLGRPTTYASSLRSADGIFTGHRITKHALEVTKRFSSVLPGQVDAVGRHPRLAWDGQCPTLRAGTGSDRGSYQSVRPLHPEYPRVITTREAARMQGFPDWFRFHPTTWHSFRMIGNSVSPVISQSIFSVIRSHLS